MAAGRIDLATGTAPTTPSAGTASLYVDSADNKIKLLDENGVLGDIGGHEPPNYLRNSGMWFAQRQVPGTLTNSGSTTLRAIGLASGSSGGGIDGWGAWMQNSQVQSRRNDTATTPETGLSARYYAEWQKTTSTGKFLISQMLEGDESIRLRGKTVRFQVKVKATAAATLRIGLIQLTNSGTIDTLPATFISAAGANGTDPTLGTNLSYVTPKSGVTPENCTVNGDALDISATTAWQRVGACWDIPSTCKNILVAVWGNSQFTSTNGFMLSECSLTEGYEIAAFAPLSYQQELSRCERIFEKSFGVDTGPAQNNGVDTGGYAYSCPVGAATAHTVGITYRTRKRAAPSQAVTLNPAAANAHVRNRTDGADNSATAITVTGSETCARVTTTSSAAAAAGEHMEFHWWVDACGANNEFC